MGPLEALSRLNIDSGIGKATYAAGRGIIQLVSFRALPPETAKMPPSRPGIANRSSPVGVV